MSIFCRGPVNPSTPTFPKINLTKTMTFNRCFEKHTKMAAIISISTFIPLMWVADYFLSHITFPSRPFRQYQSDRNNEKFDSCLEIQLEMAARISVCTLNPLKLSSNQIYI